MTLTRRSASAVAALVSALADISTDVSSPAAGQMDLEGRR
jgi:hypothetical protein